MALEHGVPSQKSQGFSKDGDKKIDNTAKTAVIQNSTEGVLSAVQGNANAIGYISLGSLTKSVKALEIDGVKASRDTVLDGEYPLQRPFNIVWSSNLSKLGQDFISFIHSKQGQQVVTDNKFIEAKTETTEYTSQHLSGKLSVVGSTSVSSLMEKLAEAYKKKIQKLRLILPLMGLQQVLPLLRRKPLILVWFLGINS